MIRTSTKKENPHQSEGFHIFFKSRGQVFDPGLNQRPVPLILLLEYLCRFHDFLIVVVFDETLLILITSQHFSDSRHYLLA